VAVTTIDDLSRLVHRAQQETKHEIIRVILHPDDFRIVSLSPAFASAAYGPSQVACRGHLWGVPIHVDPRNEKNIAYVVTRDDEHRRSAGTPYKIYDPPEPVRRTAWSRVLDDEIGVDPSSEH
jgi:hypothetical protein